MSCKKDFCCKAAKTEKTEAPKKCCTPKTDAPKTKKGHGCGCGC